MTRRFSLILLSIACIATALAAVLVRAQATPPPVPAVYANISANAEGQLVYQPEGAAPLVARDRPPVWTLGQLRGSPRGTDNGIALDFGRPEFTGTLIFGLVPYADTRYPQPVFRTTTFIKEGKAEINIKGTLSGTYDMVGWATSARGAIGYRIVGPDGSMIHDGRVRFTGTGPFAVDVALSEGPFVSNVTSTSAIVWFELDRPDACSVTIGTRVVACQPDRLRQELLVDRLTPATDYKYTVKYGQNEESYGFRTAPREGARRPFVFGYSSDSRGGQGGGDRNFFGPNAYIMRRLMSLALDRKAAFVQFTGDLVSGYVGSPEALRVELANWKRAVEPYAHWMPVYTGIGNHEVVLKEFFGEGGRSIRLDRFPFDTESTEATIASAMVNPENGPASEDGAIYDPNPASVDFPPYRRNVFSFVHDNVAMVVLNSDYWFAPAMGPPPQPGGNVHGYLMDNQLKWLAQTLDRLQANAAIDHVFLTAHTPVFPNGGHVGDDMWYGGNNGPRAVVAGKPVAKGIIERRDEILALIDSHPKVLAVLTGDEHNYNRLRIDAKVNIYPQNWTGAKVAIRGGFYQINNGAAGAPYYAQDLTPPWSSFVKGFSTQNALCLFYVAGRAVRIEVVNPETLEVLDRAVLR